MNLNYKLWPVLFHCQQTELTPYEQQTFQGRNQKLTTTLANITKIGRDANRTHASQLNPYQQHNKTNQILNSTKQLFNSKYTELYFFFWVKLLFLILSLQLASWGYRCAISWRQLIIQRMIHVQ